MKIPIDALTGIFIALLVCAAFLLIASALAGCAQIPTVQLCNHIKYERTGAHVVESAECDLPIQDLPKPGELVRAMVQ